MKRLLDLTAAAAGLLLLSPLLVPVAIAIWLQDFHSPFYVANRTGRGERPFRMVKFRSMVVRADRTGVDSTSGDDPRITALGRWIRRTKLDEVPQLWNVLRGEMSLVGPRPEEEAVVALYDERQRARLAVKPGVTGPMQVYGRSDLTFEERLAMERDYLDNLSLLTDLAILLRTPRAMVRGEGAY